MNGHRASRPLRGASLGVPLLLALPAAAGVVLHGVEGNRLRWNLAAEQPNVQGGAVTWYATPGGSENEPPGSEVEADALAACMETWTAASDGRLRFAEDRTRPAHGLDVNDRVNLLTWRKYLLGPLTLAVTYVQSRNGVILDTDMAFNDTIEFVVWSTEEEGLEGHADVRAVATHELGHLVGLDHSPVGGSTMAPYLPTGAIHTRSLEQDDVSTLAAAYPGPADPSRGSLHGTVRIGAKKTRRGVAVFALDSRTGAVAASAVTADDGRWTIPALPPGPYLVAAAPLGNPHALTAHWEKAPEAIEATFRSEPGPDGDPRPAIVRVRAGAPESAVDITVSRPPRAGTGEPDDVPAQARTLPWRGAATGAFERALDADWFLLETPDRSPVDLRVRAWGMGSSGDAELTAFAGDGVTVLGTVIDNRPGILPEWARGPAGIDNDATLDALVPPADRRILVRVRNQPHANAGSPRSFYVVTAFPSRGVPFEESVDATITPAALRAGTATTATLLVTPRDVHGDTLPPGAELLVARSDGGAATSMEAIGDGAYRAILAAPATPGPVSLAVTIRAAGRDVTVGLPVALLGAGPPDAATSGFTASPRRVEANGSSTTTLRLLPRDMRGLDLGTGLPVSFAFDGPSVGTLSAVKDELNGAYTAVLRAPSSPGRARLAVTFDGLPTGIELVVGFGYELALVSEDLHVEAAAFRARRPSLARREARVVDGAVLRLAATAGRAAADDPAGAGTAAAAAIVLLERAAATGTMPDGDDAAAELAEALRRRARTVILTMVFPAPHPKGERSLGRAKAMLAKGEALLAAHETAKGARALAAALRLVERIP